MILALIAFLVATLIEASAYLIPLIDNLIKMIATPAAIIAGILLTASFIGDMEPFMTWRIAIIDGGGVASVSHATTTAIRGTSTIATGGADNFVATLIVPLFEGVSAIFIAIFSILLLILSLF